MNIISADALKVRFRLLKLSRFQALALEREFDNSSTTKNETENDYTALLPLNQSNLHDILDLVERQNIDKGDCDICLYFNCTGQQTSGSIPEAVNQMLKYLDCRLSYSLSEPI